MIPSGWSVRTSRCAAAGRIFYNLTGWLAVDESDAAAPFLDVRTRAYSPELLALYDQPWVERLLPQVLADDERVGV